MRDDHRMNILFSILIIFTLICVCAVQLQPQTQLRIREGSLKWDQFFDEPYEIMVFVFKDQTWISFDTQEEHRVNLHPSTMISIIRDKGKSIEDVATVIHNHPIPTSFSIGNNFVFRYLKAEGFDGFFMIYYPFSEKTRIKKDG